MGGFFVWGCCLLGGSEVFGCGEESFVGCERVLHAYKMSFHRCKMVLQRCKEGF
jgi:hypothetical protein